jgi:hypothetical protein
MRIDRGVGILVVAVLIRAGLGPFALASGLSPAASPVGAAENAGEPCSRALDESELNSLLTGALQREYVRDLGELD